MHKDNDMRGTGAGTPQRDDLHPIAADAGIFGDHQAAMLLVDPSDLSIVDANPAAERFYGWPASQLRAMHLDDIDTLPLDDLHALTQRARTENPGVFHLQNRTAHDGVRDVDVYASAVELRGTTLLLAIVHDQTEHCRSERALKRMNRLYAMLSQANQLIASTPDPQALFNGVCAIAVQYGEFRFAWIGLVEADGSVTPVARAGADGGYIDTIRATANPEGRGHGPTGVAARTGDHIIVNDFSAEPRTAPWHDAAGRIGIGSSAAFPFHDAGKVVGTLNLYASERDFFSSDVVAALDEIARDLSGGLAHADRERERAALVANLAVAEARWRYALEGAGHGVWEWNAQTNHMFYSEQWKAMLGYTDVDPGDTLESWEHRVHPADLAAAKEALTRHLSGESPMYHSEHRVRCRDGSYKYIADKGRVMTRTADGKPLLVIGTHTDITDRKRAEEALRVSEQTQRRMLDALNVGVWMLDATGSVVSSNAAGKKLWAGLAEEDLDTYDVFSGWSTDTGEYLAPHDWAGARAVEKGETTIDEVIDIECHDGTKKTILNTAVPLRDDDGLVRGAIVVNHDITQRKLAEEALRDSEARYRQLFQANPQSMWVFDQNTLQFLAVNDTAVSHYGYTRDEFLRMTVTDIRLPERQSAAESLAERSGGVVERERLERHRKRDGTIIDVDVTTHALNYDGHHAIAVLAHDVTRERLAQAELRLRSAALNAAANAIVITDTSGAVAWANPAFTTLTGYSMEDARGRNMSELVASGVQDRQFYVEFWNTLLSGKDWHGELINRKKDGTRYPEELTVTPVRDDRGTTTHYIGIKRDLSADKELQALYLQAQKMESVGQLAAGIAHDFNNLLSVIISAADLALIAMHEGDPLIHDVREMREAAERASSLTQQLLSFSRRQILQPQVINLSNLVTTLERMLRRMISEDIHLVVDAKARGNIRADPGQIEQVIVNLVVNARDAMPDGGTLTISTRTVELDARTASRYPPLTPGRHIALSITDTGIGMDDATRLRVFEPFFSTKEPGKGTGLGLATAYGIVKQSNGSISVESVPARGSTFTIYFACTDAAAPLQIAPRASVRASGTETVLVVEDDTSLRRLAERMLSVAGYTVLSASNGIDGLRVLDTHPGVIHLVVTDVVMPGMTGQKLAERVAESGRPTKVLLTSGYTEDEVLRRGVSERTTNFLRKPYSLEELTAKVRQVLDADPALPASSAR